MDDLRGGRRRVRRNRGLVAGGAAIGVASIITAVSLLPGEVMDDRPQPADPPGLSTPLVAPDSLLDVRELGFHVEPVQGFDSEGLATGWSVQPDGQEVTLRWDEAGLGVYVKVLYRGLRDHTIVCTERQADVEIHGVPGCYSDNPEEGVSTPTGIFNAYLVWEYAPGSWASVHTGYEPALIEPDRVRTALLEVAEAVAPGGEAIRVPIDASELPPLVQPDTVDSIRIHRYTDGIRVDFHSPHFYFTVLPSVGMFALDCEQPASGGSPAPFTFMGHSGCFHWLGATDEPPTSFDDSAHYIELDVDGTMRGLAPRFQEHGGVGNPGSKYPLAEVKQMLADLTVAPLDDPSTWFDLKSAFSG